MAMNNELVLVCFFLQLSIGVFLILMFQCLLISFLDFDLKQKKRKNPYNVLTLQLVHLW